MQDSLNEVMPWGLTLAQTLFVGGGLFLLIVGWTFLQLVFKIGQSVFCLGLAVLGAIGCCGGVFFLAVNA